MGEPVLKCYVGELLNTLRSAEHIATPARAWILWRTDLQKDMQMENRSLQNDVQMENRSQQHDVQMKNRSLQKEMLMENRSLRNDVEIENKSLSDTNHLVLFLIFSTRCLKC